MFIHAFTIDRGGCFHYRVRQPLTYLREYGHWTSWGSGVDFETWDRATVLLQQFLHTSTSMDHWIRWCETSGKLCVWEADDDITTVHQSPHHGNAYDDPETLRRITAMISASHLVTVTTEALAKVYRQWNPHVVVLPNAVPDWLVELPAAPENGMPLVLGYTGSASHLDDYEAWSPVLLKWMRHRSAETILRYYGLGSRPEGMPLTWVTDVKPWQKQTAEYLKSLRMDVGIAPLLHTPFNAGKSPIKAMEYAALGIPAVVERHPIYENTVINGVTGFTAHGIGSWLSALESLWDDAALRLTMGAAARQAAREQFVMSRVAPLWEQAYRQAGERIGVDVG